MSSTPDNSQPDRNDQPDLNPTRHCESLRIDVIVDENLVAAIDPDSLRRAARHAAAHRDYDRGEIGIRVTDDNAIHQINKDHLGHDYPTDVISFTYRDSKPLVEGELVVSIDTAEQRASEMGWPADSELILYVVHGTLHITGMDDADSHERKLMRQAEREIMTELGLEDISRFGADVGASTSEGRA